MIGLFAALLALGAAVSDALGDATSGALARRLSPMTVLGLSGMVAVAVALLASPFLGGLEFTGTTIGFGLAASACYLIGHVFLFAAFARGGFGIVAGLSTLAVVPAAVYDSSTGMSPSATSILGIVVMLAGIALLSFGGETRLAWSITILAVVSALLIGMADVVLSVGAMESAITVTVLLYALAPIFLLLSPLLPGLRTPVEDEDASIARLSMPAVAGLVVLTGILRAATDMGVAFAGAMGNITVVVALVLTAPLFIAVFGYVFFRERLSAVQMAGLVTAIVGSVITVLG